MRLEDLGLIGNCQYSAHVAKTGEIVWCCLPRFDSEPVFSTLLDADDGGRFLVAPVDGEVGAQRYLTNTNVLETTFTTRDGRFRVVDFAPRYRLYQRYFRPTRIVRIVEPLEGAPCVRVSCEPRLGWSKRRPARIQGSNHVDFEGFESPLRLTTDIPLSYLCGQPFALTGRRHLVLAWGEPVEEGLPALCEQYLAETVRYWQTWVKHCSVPPLFQMEVIRSALVLKLHCFEDTGAIVAATTTSIPESPGSGRTWDYRYCWLRDAYYVLAAFRSLGHFEERERFTQYILDVASTRGLDLAPLYRIDGSDDLEEHVLSHWPGYEGHGPVRIGNAAALQGQNDIFGELVLALAPVFLDERFSQERSKASLDLVTRLAEKAVSVAGVPGAGIWERRAEPRAETFSSLMCWAAADRAATVAERHDPGKAPDLRAAAERIRGEMLERTWNADLGHFVATYDGNGLDAALLQLATLRFLERDDRRLHATIDAVKKGLGRGDWLYRYVEDDGLGVPTVAFLLCTFWHVQALASVGRTEEARAALEPARQLLSPLGLLSEDCDTESMRLWGNFPQAYSHVGLICAAFGASPAWCDVL